MSAGFLVIGGIIFAVYIYFTFWNIFYGHKKQKEENYPNLDKEEIVEEYLEANDIEDDSIL
jgi:hypothetical protein